ncbi:hypothetical protein CU097_011165 [Rhizopus azygosporus]|uniref:Uncharacterized protein n=1 Tax=Rhizopus azygosporus TaxID=86630 RepID=A0A367KCI6_RHIAZ|nr:hypothetical protein CU097_011165 [Rhizopus azygosporus]
MRNLFDIGKERKSLKLVKKLQEEAEIEWEKELARRREQELNDEAIAKALQDELEREETTNRDASNPFTPSINPPPLPTKPREYNPHPLDSSDHTTSSQSISGKSRSSVSISPLYGISNRNSSLPSKSYLHYKPGLTMQVTSPVVSSNVFNTPAQKPSTLPTSSTLSSTATNNSKSQPRPTSSSSLNNVQPAQNPPNNNKTNTPVFHTPMQASSSLPTVHSPPPPLSSQKKKQQPTASINQFHVPPTNNNSTNQHHMPQPHPTQTHPSAIDNTAQIQRPPVTPISYPKKEPYHIKTNNPTTQSVPLALSMPEPYAHSIRTQSEPIALPLSQPQYIKSVEPVQTHAQNMTTPYQPKQASVHPVMTLNASSPYYKTSDSFLSLKPNQEEKFEQGVPLAPKKTIIDDHGDDESSASSKYDFSDMVYVKNSKKMMAESSDNPFDDTNAVKEIQIVDPTLHIYPLATEEKVEQKNEAVVVTSKEKTEQTWTRGYVEKESTERPYAEKESTERLYAEKESADRSYAEKESKEIEPVRPLVRPDDDDDDKPPKQVFPTNILRAGAPVPSNEYGYYSVDKDLPTVPQSANKEDRHITVASVNPGQRVWIRIHPTDTGKTLAERIHIVATYQTRKVTKITTKNGRNIPLDNTPLFADWNEILSFEEGEPWTVEWTYMDHPYLEKLAGGKEWVKHLKSKVL